MMIEATLKVTDSVRGYKAAIKVHWSAEHPAQYKVESTGGRITQKDWQKLTDMLYALTEKS